MKFELAPLPYEADALEPFLGVSTVKTHYEKHHAGYVEKLNKLVADDATDKTLTDLVLESEGHAFNMAAQVWNHDFYWRSLTPERTEVGDGALRALVLKSFGDWQAMESEFAKVASGVFGSGWAWLTFDPKDQTIRVEGTGNAGNPLTEERVPLLTLDVWEHAYYLDYRQDRAGYVKAFIDAHANWAFAEENLEVALKRMPL